MVTLWNWLVRALTISLPMSSVFFPQANVTLKLNRIFLFFSSYMLFFYATYYFIVENRLSL